MPPRCRNNETPDRPRCDRVNVCRALNWRRHAEGGGPARELRSPCYCLTEVNVYIRSLPVNVQICTHSPGNSLASLELEEVVERLPCVVNSRRRGLAFDGRPRLVEGAGIPGSLGGHTHRYGLHALEAAPWVERCALGAGVKVCAAANATALEPDGLFDDRPALGASHHLPEPRHVDVARTVLRDAASAGWSAGLLRRTRCRFLGTIPVVILVAAEAVFSVTHALSSIVAGIVCERQAVSKLTPGGRGSTTARRSLLLFLQRGKLPRMWLARPGTSESRRCVRATFGC